MAQDAGPPVGRGAEDGLAGAAGLDAHALAPGEHEPLGEDADGELQGAALGRDGHGPREVGEEWDKHVVLGARRGGAA